MSANCWWLAHYRPAESFGPTTLERLERTGTLAQAFELGPRALIAVVIESSGEPDGRHWTIVRRFGRAEARRRWEDPTEAELAFVRRMLAEQGERSSCA